MRNVIYYIIQKQKKKLYYILVHVQILEFIILKYIYLFIQNLNNYTSEN